MKYITIILVLIFCTGMSGRYKKKPRQDGVWINGRIVIQNGTVEQFCKSEGNLIEFLKKNKVQLSRGE